MSALDYSAYPGEKYTGIHFANLWYAPEEALRRKCGSLYENHPILARGLWVPLCFCTGAIKPFLFALSTVVGVIAMPIIASLCFILGAVTGKKEYYKYGEGWLKAWSWSLVALASLATLLFLTTYVCPLIVPTSLIIVGVGVSISIHVYRALLNPPASLEELASSSGSN